MKLWLKRLGVILMFVITATAIPLFSQEQKGCCLCSSFRYYAPCLIDLETGKLIELNLYFPHHTLVAEQADPQPDMRTFSFVKLGAASGIKLTGNKKIELHIPNDKTFNPALCSNCRKQLSSGHTNRYILADLYGKEEKVLIPIKADAVFSLRCYDITTEKNAEKGGISMVIQGTLDQ